MRQYEMFELEFQGKEPEGSWTDVPFGAVLDGRMKQKKLFLIKGLKDFMLETVSTKCAFVQKKQANTHGKQKAL